MGAVYAANFENVSVSVAQDLFEIASSATNMIRLRRVRISSAKTTSEVLRLTINRNTGAATSGSGGSTPTIRTVSPGARTALSTVEANNTTRVASGTKETIVAEQWNAITTYEWVPTDSQAQIEMGLSDHLTVALEAAPAAAILMSGWIEWEEIGG